MSIKRIEYFGQSGVGKTTLYKSLSSRNNIKCEWLSSKEADLNVARGITRTLSKHKGNTYYVGTYIPIINKLIIQQMYSKAYSVTEIDEYCGELVYDILNYCIGYRCIMLFVLYKLNNRLLPSIAKVLLHEKHINGKMIVYDESISHFLMDLIFTFPDDIIDEITTTLYHKVIIPDGIIYLSASPKIIYDRIVSRKKKNMLWINKYTKKELLSRIERYEYIMNKGIQIYKERSVPIIEIDTTFDLSTQNIHATSFINEVIDRDSA